ncbi:hypothetical protein B0J11DRAFT_503334 [Dendryphion nanum]|uniref:Uncharacterized protein n=1 Tax=Dendryphion nanum TaxID=256645 RepID=A0A9P9E7E9_9PLEO|nr:hypothetical protein B0J11DRAFT_503334 [Dendryphion nanum]
MAIREPKTSGLCGQAEDPDSTTRKNDGRSAASAMIYPQHQVHPLGGHIYINAPLMYDVEVQYPAEVSPMRLRSYLSQASKGPNLRNPPRPSWTQNQPVRWCQGMPWHQNTNAKWRSNGPSSSAPNSTEKTGVHPLLTIPGAGPPLFEQIGTHVANSSSRLASLTSPISSFAKTRAPTASPFRKAFLCISHLTIAIFTVTNASDNFRMA